MTAESETPDTQRLRRHLRALAAVNRQLQAQLEGGNSRPLVHSVVPGDDLVTSMSAADARWTPVRVRRGSVGTEWLKQLRRSGVDGAPFLVHAPARGVFVIEGTVRREVMSGLLAAALARVLGPVRAIADEEIAQWSEGPPVAVLEGGTGRPFVVVGGRRFPLRGLPLPYPVNDDEVLALPVGEELHITSGGRSGPSQVERARALVAHEGPGRATVVLLHKVARRIRRVGTGIR